MTGYGKIKKGYEYPMLKFVVISESDIFGGEKKKRSASASMRERRLQALRI